MKRCSMSHVIREKDTSTHLLKCPNLRTSTTSNASEQAKQWKLSFTAGRNAQQAGRFRWQFAAAAMSLQSCPTLCNPIDGSPPGSPVLGILQERTLEWVAISFSNAWKWKVKVKSLSCVRLCDPMDCSLPGSSVCGIFQARVLEWGATHSYHVIQPSCSLVFIPKGWKRISTRNPAHWCLLPICS